MKQLSIYDDFIENQDDLFKYEPKQTITPPIALHPRTQKAATVTISSNQELKQQKARPTHSKNVFTAPGKANVTEIILAKDKADCIQLLLPMLAHLNQESRWLAWIDPPMQLLKQWQQQYEPMTNCDIMVLRSNSSTSSFTLTEKALRAGTCHAVIAWTESLNQDEFTKLEDASSTGNSHGIILRYR